MDSNFTLKKTFVIHTEKDPEKQSATSDLEIDIEADKGRIFVKSAYVAAENIPVLIQAIVPALMAAQQELAPTPTNAA